ncbi:MAG: hypothetical protein AAGC67_18780 [Myxococcota bacterium]
MASAMPRRVDRTARERAPFARGGPVERSRPTVRVAARRPPQGLDVCRLMVAAAGLSAGVALPAGLLLWAASDVLLGLGTRVVAMLS